MKKIKCTDTIISMDNVESMKLIPSKDFIGQNGGITFHPKGEKYYKKNFWSERQSFNFNTYEFNIGHYAWHGSARVLVDDLKSSEGYPAFILWESFIDDKEQIFYNEAKDCVSRKATIEIRTKSGNTLYAVYDTDESAQEVINEFLES
jgi:hypothetical protein